MKVEFIKYKKDKIIKNNIIIILRKKQNDMQCNKYNDNQELLLL